MNQFSVAAALVWQIAAMEVKESHYEYIEPEHLFIGICSLEKMLMLTGKSALTPEDRKVVQSEYTTIEEVLGMFEIKTAHLRRNARRKLGRGRDTQIQGTIHRNEECKRVFMRAEKFVGATQPIACPHLLAALLEKPGDIITIIFQEIGVAPADIQEHIMSNVALKQSTKHIGPETSQEPNHLTKEDLTQYLTTIKRFKNWKTLKKEVFASFRGGNFLGTTSVSLRNTHQQRILTALNALVNLQEGEPNEERGYNVHRFSRIADTLNTRKEAIFGFLEFLETSEDKATVLRALLDITDPAEHEYKYLIQRFLGLTNDIDEEATLKDVLSQASAKLKGTERVLIALHNINEVLSAQIADVLNTRKDTLDALLESLQLDEMGDISQKIGEERTFPLYIGFVLYAVAAKTQGKITIGTFLRKYMCKEVPLYVLLGMFNRNVFAGSYKRSTFVRPEVIDFPMDIAGSRVAIQEILRAFDETLTKSQIIIDKKNIVLKKDVEGTPVKILCNPQGDITIDRHVMIQLKGKIRHIILTSQEGRWYEVKNGKVFDAINHTEIPGPLCNIVGGTNIFLSNVAENAEMIKQSLLHTISQKGVVYGSPEPTQNELNAANKLINRQKAAESKRAGLLEGERPKPLHPKQLMLIYIMKCALEKFYMKYMEDPDEYFRRLLRETGTSRAFQMNLDLDIHALARLVFHIENQLLSDKSGGWQRFWELFTITIPEQVYKYIEMSIELRDNALFIAPVQEIQRKLGELYWNIARLMLIKGGNYLPPIPKSTPPSGAYKKDLEKIRQEIQDQES